MTQTVPQNPLQDAALQPYRFFLQQRGEIFSTELARITEQYGSLRAYANLHHSLGAHKIKDAAGRSFWRLREYMPHAAALWLTTDALNFQRHAHFQFTPQAEGFFELVVPEESLHHGSYMELRVQPGNAS
ncbi:1,4-alpha-glucan branching protein, partial [Desulfovibrio sp. 1214_IL3152]